MSATSLQGTQDRGNEVGQWILGMRLEVGMSSMPGCTGTYVHVYAKGPKTKDGMSRRAEQLYTLLPQYMSYYHSQR